MALKVVLVPLTGGAGCNVVANAAARIARKFGALLLGVHIRPDPATAVPYLADGLTTDIIHELVATADKAGTARAATARKAFEGAIAEFGFSLVDDPTPGVERPARWMEMTGPIAETVGRLGRIADLTVVAKPDIKNEPNSLAVLDSALTRSGRALLMVPSEVPESMTSHILIAWNGSAEAARAVASALDVLHAAQRVEVACVGELHPERPDCDAIGEYLMLHGVDADVRRIEKDKRGVGETILRHADEIGASMLVVGAYSHSRWRELVLGGVTRVLVDKAELPVFMTH